MTKTTLASFFAVAMAATIVVATAVSNRSAVTGDATAVVGDLLGLRVSIKCPLQCSFVENAGLGEEINVAIRLASNQVDWDRLQTLKGFDFDAQASLFRVIVSLDEGAEFEVHPSSFNFVHGSGDTHQHEWDYLAGIRLSELVPRGVKPPQQVKLQAHLIHQAASKIMGREEREDLTSNSAVIKLRPQQLDTASFTDRLHSLSAGVSVSDVRRILGKAIADMPSDPLLKEAHPQYSRRLTYRNPDYKQFAKPGEDRDLDYLFFDDAGRLVDYSELIYGC